MKCDLCNVWKGLIPLCWKEAAAGSMTMLHFRLIEYEKCTKIKGGEGAGFPDSRRGRTAFPVSPARWLLRHPHGCVGAAKPGFSSNTASAVRSQRGAKTKKPNAIVESSPCCSPEAGLERVGAVWARRAWPGADLGLHGSGQRHWAPTMPLTRSAAGPERQPQPILLHNAGAAVKWGSVLPCHPSSACIATVRAGRPKWQRWGQPGLPGLGHARLELLRWCWIFPSRRPWGCGDRGGRATNTGLGSWGKK